MTSVIFRGAQYMVKTAAGSFAESNLGNLMWIGSTNNKTLLFGGIMKDFRIYNGSGYNIDTDSIPSNCKIAMGSQNVIYSNTIIKKLVLLLVLPLVLQL